MRKTRLINTLLVSLVSLSALSQATGRPRLVVGITVDQMRTDPLEQLRNLLGQKGFRLLLDKGVYIKDINFGAYTPDIASGTSQLLTGATPQATGITGRDRYETTTHFIRPTLAPKGSYTPEPLLLSTIADEIGIDGIGLGAIYSVAASPEIAVIAGGHSPSGAIWIDSNTGKWTTSAYYGALPRAAGTRNMRQSLPSRVDTMQWKPLLPLDRYIGIPAQKRMYPFRHTYPSSRPDTYSRLAISPQGNREVTDMAIDLMKVENLGKRGDAVDMLNIGYSLAPCREVADGDYRLEQQDAYLRLDADLERLLDALDKQVGMDNVVLWLLPTGYYDDAVEIDARYKVPGGEFSIRRAQSLLNSYLSAKYGNADWVAGMHGEQLYLRREALDKAWGHTEQEITRDARDFLMKMSGVAAVYTLEDILGGTTPELRDLRMVTDAATAGNLLVKIRPGWKVTDDTHTPARTWMVRESAVMTPGFLFAPNLNALEINYPVEATEIAPTITRTLHIRSPNGSRGKGLIL